MSSDQLDLRNLQKLIKLFGKNPPTARVGILGGGGGRVDGKVTNADIGAKHEFGDEKTPRRSWLQMPIAEKMSEKLDNSGVLSEAGLKRVMNEMKLDIWMRQIGILGEQCILEAFDTGGFGQWKPSDMSMKTNWQTLVETGQLRRSVTSDIKEGDV